METNPVRHWVWMDRERIADTDDDREVDGGHGLTMAAAQSAYYRAIERLLMAGSRITQTLTGETNPVGIPGERTTWIAVAGTPEGAEANRIVQVLGCHCSAPMVEDCTDPRPPVRRGDCPAGSVRQESATPLKGRPDILAQLWRCSHCGATQLRYRPAVDDGGQEVIG